MKTAIVRFRPKIKRRNWLTGFRRVWFAESMPHWPDWTMLTMMTAKKKKENKHNDFVVCAKCAWNSCSGDICHASAVHGIADMGGNFQIWKWNCEFSGHGWRNRNWSWWSIQIDWWRNQKMTVVNNILNMVDLNTKKYNDNLKKMTKTTTTETKK